MSRKPPIVIDIAPLFEDHWTGIPVFTRRLIQALWAQGDLELQFSFHLTQIPERIVRSAIQAGNGTAMRCRFEREAGESFPAIDSSAFLFYPSVKEACGIGASEASTIHDVSTLVMPEYHEQANVDYHMTRLAPQLASDDVVFCISEATRAAVSEYFPSARDKVKLLTQFVDWPQSFDAIERNLPPPFASRYVAVIGTVEPRKNLGLLLNAMMTPELQDCGYQFVVLGKQGWKTQELMSQLLPEQQQRVHFLGYVTEFAKYRILKHAEFLVYPSIYEGFGIPALEAMSLGKPVLSAMTSSLPEVIGDAGIYFDPLSVSEFVDAFREMSSPSALEELAPRARARARAYTWQRFAQPVVDWVTAVS